MQSKHHILYVEDHDDTRVVMSLLLEEAGFQVTSVNTGQEFVTLAKSQRFDLYLLNHTFPDASGVALCMGVREYDTETPILFYSSRAMPAEKEQAMKAGANDYLIKPNDIFNIAEHATKWISRSQRQSDGNRVMPSEATHNS